MIQMGTILKQVYIPYTEWEDWINGMWRKVSPEDEIIMLKQAIDFTGDHIIYGQAMSEVINAWPKTMLNSLTNTSINRRAFLGHCAVCYKTKIPEYITRRAWKELTNEQRINANKVAQQNIDQYAKTNKRIHKNMGTQMLLEWDPG